MTLALNSLIAFLLLVTIVFCWKLNQKIAAIHKSKKDILTLLKCFDNAVLRAEESIKLLKHTSANAGKSLQDDIEKAKALVEDLNFMIERAATVTDKLESGISYSRQAENPALKTERALHPAFRLTPSSKVTAPPPPLEEKTASKRSSIEILLERLAGKNPPKTAKDQRIPYKTPEELGAMAPPSSAVAGKDLMQLLQSVQG